MTRTVIEAGSALRRAHPMTPDLREFAAADRHAHTPSVWQEVREEFGSVKRALFGWGVVMALLFFGSVWGGWMVYVAVTGQVPA